MLLFRPIIEIPGTGIELSWRATPKKTALNAYFLRRFEGVVLERIASYVSVQTVV
jgi:hypothetical protein